MPGSKLPIHLKSSLPAESSTMIVGIAAILNRKKIV